MGESSRKSVTTDASLLGCGAHMEGAMAQGVWSLEEACFHINVLMSNLIGSTEFSGKSAGRPRVGQDGQCDGQGLH